MARAPRSQASSDDPVRASLVRFRRDVARRTTRAVSEGFFQSISGLARLHPQARPERHGVELIPNVPYQASGDEAHLLDIYKPTEHEGPRPVVLYIHGGGFRLLSKDTHWVMGLIFARYGYLVFNMSYRLAPKHPYPAPMDDVASAYEWVVANAERYGGDVSRLVVAGESAGANLTCATAVAASYRREEPFAKRIFDTGVVPSAVVPFCGILEVENIERFLERRRLPAFIKTMLVDVASGYLDGTPDDVSLALASPLAFLERMLPPDRPLPAFFVPVGTKDPLLDDTRRLVATLEAMGVDAQAAYYQGEVHAFEAFVWRRAARQCWQDTLAFLEPRIRAGRARYPVAIDSENDARRQSRSA